MAPATPSFFSSSSSNLFSTPPTAAKTFSFGASQSTPTAQAVEDANVDMTEEDDDAPTLHLDPAPIPAGGISKWSGTGRTLQSRVSPVGGTVAAWVAKKQSDPVDTPPTLDSMYKEDKAIWFSQLHPLPAPLVQLYSATYTLFLSLNRIHAQAAPPPNLPYIKSEKQKLGMSTNWNATSSSGINLPSAQQIMYYVRICRLYRDALLQFIASDDISDSLRERHASIMHIMHLTEILFLPPDGRGEGVVGEEILDWVNGVDIAPSTEEGEEILRMKEPWEHEAFWAYIYRSLLRGFHNSTAAILQSLSAHPHRPVAKLAQLLATQLSLFPRSTNTATYPLEHQFLVAHQKWHQRFRVEIQLFVGGKEKGSWLEEEGWEEWEDCFRGVIELMEGKEARVLAESADWREALGAWGVLVNSGLRRDDLPSVLGRILEEVPVDSTLLDETIQSALCSGDITKAIMASNDFDPWLVAHLTDLLDKLGLVEDDSERFDQPLRTHFLLNYTDILQSDTFFWRITGDYLALCGSEGWHRMKELLVRVALGGETSVEKPEAAEDTSMETETPAVDRFARLRDVLAECRAHGLPEEARMICKVMADRLIRQGEFGIAVSFCIHAEDGHRLGRIAQEVLQAYITNGPKAFLDVIKTIPASLLDQAPTHLLHQAQAQPRDPYDPLSSAFPSAEDAAAEVPVSLIAASKLSFLAKFRDFLLFLDRGDRELAAQTLVNVLTSQVAPIGFWAVLLVDAVPLLEDEEILFTSEDTFELLRIVELITEASSYAASEYLTQLSTLLTSRGEKDKVAKRSEKEGLDRALKQLDIVRLAIARNLARASVVRFHEPF